MPEIIGIDISDISKQIILGEIAKSAVQYRKLHIVTANPEILLQAWLSKKYFNLIKSADLVVADGIGIKYAAITKGYIFKNRRITGVELTEDVIAMCQTQQLKLMVIGSTQEIIQKATHNVIGRDLDHTMYFAKAKIDIDSDANEIINTIVKYGPHIILLALGHVKQELLIDKIKNFGCKCVFIGVGGSFDYLSDHVTRPNYFIRALGLEWVFRLVYEPRKRFIRIIKAVIIFPIIYLYSEITKVFHVEQSSIDKTT